MNTEQEFIVWTAGFFDGEGSVVIACGIRGTRKTTTDRQFWLGVSITNTNLAILKVLKERFGGNIWTDKKQNRSAKTCSRWVAQSWVAASFLETVLPYLRVKREEALVGLEFQQTVKKRGNGTPVYKQIAEMAQTSRYAVHRVLTGKGDVQPEVRSRIEEAAKTLGYLGKEENMAARFEERWRLKQKLEALRNSHQARRAYQRKQGLHGLS